MCSTIHCSVPRCLVPERLPLPNTPIAHLPQFPYGSSNGSCYYCLKEITTKGTVCIITNLCTYLPTHHNSPYSLYRRYRLPAYCTYPLPYLRYPLPSVISNTVRPTHTQYPLTSPLPPFPPSPQSPVLYSPRTATSTRPL